MSRRQANIIINDGFVYWRIYESLNNFTKHIPAGTGARFIGRNKFKQRLEGWDVIIHPCHNFNRGLCKSRIYR